MSARLLRALSAGGCTAKTRSGDWAVWRNRDRRGREIGLLMADEVEQLQMAGHLKPLGMFEDGRLVWCGPDMDMSSGKCSPEALLRDDRTANRRLSLAQRLIARCKDPRVRQRMRLAMQDYGEDVERALTRSGAGGMNWQAIRAGTAIQGGPGHRGASRRRAFVFDAVQRLEQIETSLGPDRLRLLDKIIIEGASRSAIAGWLVMKPAQCERHCLKVIGQLADAYDQLTRRPGRAVRRPV